MPALTTPAQGQPGQKSQFEQNLNRLAEIAIGAGLGLAPGQELVMTATLEALPLVRLITEHAWKLPPGRGPHN